jgi:hypothetical protein
MPHVEVRLIDRPERDENPHLDFVLLDTVGVIERFRREGRTVLVHASGLRRRRGGATVHARKIAPTKRSRHHDGTPRCPPELCVPSPVAAHRVSLIRRRFN